MAKRKSRVKPLAHHREQLETLKTLEPNTTPARWRAFSDTLLDVAIQALEIAQSLEAGKKPRRQQVERLVMLVAHLPDCAPRKGEAEAE